MKDLKFNNHCENKLKFPIHKNCRKFRFNKYPAYCCKYHTTFCDTFLTNMEHDILGKFSPTQNPILYRYITDILDIPHPC